MRAIGGNAPTQRLFEVRHLPATDAGFPVRGYVGREDRSVRGLKSPPARVRAPTVPGIGMTLLAARRAGEIASTDRGRRFGRNRRQKSERSQDYGRKRRPQLSFSRNVS